MTLDSETDIRVWDSTSEVRYMVLPMRPEGTEDLGEQALEELVPRDALVGAALARQPDDSAIA